MSEQKKNYRDYLQLDTLLFAQKPISGKTGKAQHEEMLFIIVHQAHELWFKQILHELDSINRIFSKQQINDTRLLQLERRLERIHLIQRLLLEQIDVLNTMTPMEFLAFRGQIVPASGLQSLQFRLLEIKLGIKHTQLLHCLNEKEIASIKKAESEPGLFDAVEKWLERTPFVKTNEFSFWQAYQEAIKQLLKADKKRIQEEVFSDEHEKKGRLKELEKTAFQFEAFFDKDSYQALLDKKERRLSFKASLAALFILLYRDQPALQLPYRILSHLTQIDEGFTSWRIKHVLMVQRMIGNKMGSGGSSGLSYLEKGLKYQAFYDITTLSTFMLSSSAIPRLPSTLIEQLGFTYHHDTD